MLESIAIHNKWVELRQLKYFEAVARCGGFSRAATKLHIAQPAISSQVRRLERELGATLFERTTRRVSLTQAGQRLLARTQAVLAELDGARADLDDLQQLLTGRLRIGATPILGSFDLPASLATFHRRYPELALTLRTGLVGGLLRDLDAGEVDLVLGPIHDDLPPRNMTQVLSSERLVIITPVQSSNAGRPTRLADLHDCQFVCLPEGSGLRAILVNAAQRAGFTPKVQFEAADPAGIRALVSAGLGVALLAESASTVEGPPIAIFPISNAPQHPPIGMILNRDQPANPALRAFRQHLAAHAAE